MIARLLIAPIRWYKKYLSPHLGTKAGLPDLQNPQ